MRVIILLAAVAVASAFHQECGENAHWEQCGTACPLTCDNYDNPPKICILRCDIGCHCDEGYVKTSDGRCVKPEECPARAHERQCGENAHWEECGTACPLTCDNYDNPPKICILRCDIGCHCDKGYVKTSDGRCVKPEECPARAHDPYICGSNSHFSECASACPLTCDNYANPPKICPAMCVFGCQCEKGFVLTKERRCVRPEECENTQAAVKKTCDEAPEPGMCLAYIPSWYYDPKTGKCEQFIYGGCQGNGNRYSTEEECLQNCRGVSSQSASVEACDLPSETGVCRGYFPRFYFDRTTGQCEKFVYGGCGGNENNFETIKECQETCASAAAPSACLEDKVKGPCRARFMRYFFNQETGKCEQFVYGGCGGNSNNFMSQEDCEGVCLA